MEFAPGQLSEMSAELNAALSDLPATAGKKEGKRRKELQKTAKELEKHSEKLDGHNQHPDTLGDRNSYSKTDKDATFMRMKEDAMNNGQTKPGYNLQIGTENQFIADFALFPNPTDTLTYIPFMEPFNKRYGLYPSTETADSGYGSEVNYRFMEEHGIEAFVKHNRFHMEQRPRHVQGPFRSENFYHNEKEDCCVCPTGRRMERTGQRNVKTASGHLPERHRCQSRNCDGCPLRPLCFNAAGNRTVERNRRLEKYRRQAFDLLASEEGLRQRGRRCVEPEAVLGQMKSHMAYRRFRHFGKDKVTMDFAFFAMAFNLKKMVAKMKPGGFKRHLDCMNFIFHLVVRNVSHPGTFDKQKQIKLAA